MRQPSGSARGSPRARRIGIDLRFSGKEAQDQAQAAINLDQPFPTQSTDSLAEQSSVDGEHLGYVDHGWHGEARRPRLQGDVARVGSQALLGADLVRLFEVGGVGMRCGRLASSDRAASGSAGHGPELSRFCRPTEVSAARTSWSTRRRSSPTTGGASAMSRSRDRRWPAGPVRDVLGVATCDHRGPLTSTPPLLSEKPATLGHFAVDPLRRTQTQSKNRHLWCRQRRPSRVIQPFGPIDP